MKKLGCEITRAKKIVGGVMALLFFLLVAGIFAKRWMAENEEPNRYLMRTYRAQQLSENDIRRFQLEAKAEYERAVEKAKDDGDKFWAAKNSALAKCGSDVAYKEKHPDDCGLPLMAEAIGKPDQGNSSAEIIFERKMMGFCAYVHTIKDAKRVGCLPQ